MKFAEVEVNLVGVGGRGPGSFVKLNHVEVPTRGVSIEADMDDVTRVELRFPTVAVLGKFTEVDVVGLFGGLDPAEMLNELADVMGRPAPAGFEVDVRWRRLLEDLAATLAAKGASHV